MEMPRCAFREPRLSDWQELYLSVWNVSEYCLSLKVVAFFSFWVIENLNAMEKEVPLCDHTVLPDFPAWHHIFETGAGSVLISCQRLHWFSWHPKTGRAMSYVMYQPPEYPPGEGLALTISCSTGLWFGKQLRYAVVRVACIAEQAHTLGCSHRCLGGNLTSLGCPSCHPTHGSFRKSWRDHFQGKPRGLALQCGSWADSATLQPLTERPLVKRLKAIYLELQVHFINVTLWNKLCFKALNRPCVFAVFLNLSLKFYKSLFEPNWGHCWEAGSQMFPCNCCF